ncbi:hypothetical protein [Bacillus sp. JJ722]|uniref:hypothetical protein n=1 Tax=Bacillus sp. JJ722 TaxID=3122973 RepID=UPI002FFF5BFF
MNNIERKKTMTLTFNSTNEKPWLKENHQKRRERTIQIGKKTIDLLREKDISVTFANIAQWSKEVDDEGKGIHLNTIRTNEHLYEYYKQNSKTFKQNENNKKVNPKGTVKDIDFHNIKPNRNLDNLYRRYMEFSKQELVQRLILAEQYISENENKWVSAHFESFK